MEQRSCSPKHMILEADQRILETRIHACLKTEEPPVKKELRISKDPKTSSESPRPGHLPSYPPFHSAFKRVDNERPSPAKVQPWGILKVESLQGNSTYYYTRASHGRC